MNEPHAPASLADNKAYFFLGDFDAQAGKLTPDESFGGVPALLDYGSNVFTGPSALLDPVSGNTYLFSIMQDQRTGAEEGASGWAHCVGLPRRIWLNDDGMDVKIAPIDALASLEGEALAQGTSLSVEEANELLSGVSGDMIHLRVTADLSRASGFSVNVKSDGDKGYTSQGHKVNQGVASTVRQKDISGRGS